MNVFIKRTSHKGFLDVVVAEQAVYELKTASAITDEHAGQLLTYLHLLDLPHGKLVNFRPVSVESRYVNSPITSAERRAFDVEEVGYTGSRDFLDLVVNLCRDWGTSLTLYLYQEALVALLGGAESVDAMLPSPTARRTARHRKIGDRSKFSYLLVLFMNRKNDAKFFWNSFGIFLEF